METNPTPEQAAKEAWNLDIENRVSWIEKRVELNFLQKEYFQLQLSELYKSYQTSIKKMVEEEIKSLSKQLKTETQSTAQVLIVCRIKENEKFLESITTAMPPTK